MSAKIGLVLKLTACCALIAIAGVAFGAGEYQPTRDNKTKIWNWTPKGGETASWSGDRDNDGYASGFGDLTLYDGIGKASGVYYGNMVQGKFEGPVNVHSGDRTLHAYFAAGDRVSGWSRGRAPSNMPVPQEAQKRRAEAEKHKAEETKLAAKKQQAAEAEATPVVKKAKAATPEKIAKVEASPAPAESAVRGPETYHKPTAENSPPMTSEKKSAPLSAEEELKRTEPEKSTSRTRSYSEPTPLPKSEAAESLERPTPNASLPAAASSPALSPSSQSSVQETPPVLHEAAIEPTPTPEIAQSKSETSESPRVAAAEVKAQPSSTPSDVSVNALAGPPSSLRTDSVPAKSSPEAKETEPPAKTGGPLTEADAIKLADDEAASHGCPLQKYERPKVDHSAVKGKWTLFYSLKPDMGNLPPAFSATVDDKTRKAEIHK